MVSFGVCICIQYFFAVQDVIRNKYLYWSWWKRRSKVQENNISQERALNFDQWKIFSENYKPMRVWLELVRNLPSIIVACDFTLSSFRLKRGILQNSFPNLNTSCNRKLKCFLWTKLLQSLFLAKYLISVYATSMIFSTAGRQTVFKFCLRVIFTVRTMVLEIVYQVHFREVIAYILVNYTVDIYIG